MGTVLTPEQHRKILHDILTAERTVVLLTRGEDGSIAGRPMHRVRTDDEGTTYLVTSIDSQKVAELAADPRVSLSVQGHKGFALVDGDVHVSRDRTLIDALWQDSWKAWFPDGKTDPAIAILIVEPIRGTYWQQDLGHGLSYLYRTVKARLTGTEVEERPGDQQTVDLRTRH